MTDKQFYENLGYLSNPKRGTNIEVEMPERRQTGFITEYAELTNNYPLPIDTNTAPYYVYSNVTNKYGLEARLYFESNNNLPNTLNNILEPRKKQNRPGYTEFNRRISTKEPIFKFLSKGFLLGCTQDKTRIEKFVPQKYIDDFKRCYNW